MAWDNLSPRRRVWYVLPRKMRNSPSVPKLKARDPEGVEAGAVGETTVGWCVSAPTPTSCPPNCSCHHILPSRGQGAAVGVHGPGIALAPFAVPQLQGPLLFPPRSGPRHPGSQRRVLLCHTDLDNFLVDSATLYPNSDLKWSCKTPVLVYLGYRCRNEVFSRVCPILTHTAARIHLPSAFHASSASLQELGSWGGVP